MPEMLNQNQFRWRLVVNGIDWDVFNGPSLELGSENSEARDPRYGVYPNGGVQTGTEIDCFRNWDRLVDPKFAAQGKAERGRAPVQASLIEYDTFGNAVGVVVQMTGKLTGVSYPAPDVNSSDPGEFHVMVQLGAS